MSNLSQPENGKAPTEEAAQIEIDRQRRLIDQMTSMQATLRDWDRTLGTFLVCLVLVTSLVGVAFAFASGAQVVTILGIRAQRTTLLGWLAVFTFAVTLVELVLDPRGAGRRRAQAVQALATLKGEYRAVSPPGQIRKSEVQLSQQYETVMSAIPEVPNLLFNRLKAAHLRKVEISKILSGQPGVSLKRARRILNRRLK